MKKKNHAGRVAMEVGAGAVAAAALAMAGAYLLSGKEGKKRQIKMKAWAIKAQNEVAKNVKIARNLGESEYKRIVDKAVKRYGSMGTMNAAEIAKVARDIKSEWSRIKSHAEKMTKEIKPKKKIVAKRKKTKTTKRKTR